MSSENPGAIRFLLNGEVISAADVEPTRSVLNYLRENLQLSGTKEGCAEGDCGACTVVLGELLDNDQLELKAVNACIQFVPTLDGKALFTVEALRQRNGELHPVQQAMVDEHGSQCGFCTPGFIMSLWSVYNQYQALASRPNQTDLRTALSGNLCRCTGYRPILEAGEKMFDLPAVDFDYDGLKQQLQALKRSEALVYDDHGVKFYAPKTIAELTRLRAEHPQATLLAGCTDIGLWVNKQFRELGDIIYIGEVAELKNIDEDDQRVRIGAGANLSDAYQALANHYPQITEMWERFASVPIRNAGTLGGNVANGSPIGDSMPWLIALGARVVLRSESEQRTIALEDLYLDYMKKSMRADEIVEALEVPLPAAGQVFRTYKISKRYDSDISAVCAAFALQLDGERITDARIAFGGMAATPKRASRCEQALQGQSWDETSARAAMAALAEDYTPLSDMRSSADYRQQCAQNLLYRFFLETRTENPLTDAELNVFAA